MMDRFLCCSTFKYVLLIYLTINNVLADIVDDFAECRRQLRLAFGNNETCTGCFRYAVENYIKEQGVPIPVEENIIQITPTKVNSLEELMSDVQPDNSQYATNPYMKVTSFDDLMSSGKADNSSKQMMSSSKADNSSKQLMSSSKAGPPTTVNTFEELLSGFRTGPPTTVNTFEELLSGLQAGRPTTVNTFEELLSGLQAAELKEVTTEHKEVTNYAMMYYELLESMAQGNGVLRRYEYCHDNYLDTFKDCFDSTHKFGKTSRSAVITALTLYSLFEYDNNFYIYSYMQHITEKVYLISPSKMPKRFCNETIKKKYKSEKLAS